MRKPRSKEVHCVVCGLIDSSKNTRKAQIIQPTVEETDKQELVDQQAPAELLYSVPSQSSRDCSNNERKQTIFEDSLVQYLHNASSKLLSFKEEDSAVEQLARNMQQILTVLEQSKRVGIP